MNFRACIAELIGTFALVFVGVGAITMDYVSGGKLGIVGIALAHGLTIATMGTAMGPISGGHFNPAVTLGLLAAKKIEILGALTYIFSQCLGAVGASYLLLQMMPPEALQMTSYGIPALGSGVLASNAFVVELILTFFLVFVVFGAVVDQRAPRLGALLIGLVIVGNIFAGGPLTGAGMNPARWLGPALTSGNWANSWVYVAAPVIGGVLAALVFVFLTSQKPSAANEKT